MYKVVTEEFPLDVEEVWKLSLTFGNPRDLSVTVVFF